MLLVNVLIIIKIKKNLNVNLKLNLKNLKLNYKFYNNSTDLKCMFELSVS